MGPVRPAQRWLGKTGLNFSPRRRAARSLSCSRRRAVEEQEGKLLDGVERVREPAGPELVPEGIDGGAEVGIGQHR